MSAFIELGSLIEQGIAIPEAVNAMTGIEPYQGWCMPNEAIAIFGDMGLDIENKYPKQEPAESWLEVEDHRKKLFETPLWTGALSKNEAEEVQPETF
mgnify:CR=1 FL=1